MESTQGFELHNMVNFQPQIFTKLQTQAGITRGMPVSEKMTIRS